LWLFRWDGSGFRTEAGLAGDTIELLPESPLTLRRLTEERRWGPNDPVPVVEDLFRWQNGGFRLVARSLTTSTESAPPVGPEQATLAYYRAIGRGDPAAAYALLSAEEQAARPFELFAAGLATTREVRVEELSAQYGGGPFGPLSSKDASVRVRFSAVDASPRGRLEQTFAGTWQARQTAAGWRLSAPRIGPSLPLEVIAAALPGGAEPTTTADGDLRGLGRSDLAVAFFHPGRRFPADLAVLFRAADPATIELSVRPLDEEQLGAFVGDLRIADANGDGRNELVYEASTGAHSGLLNILAWDGVALAILYSGFSNSPGVSSVDLDGDGAEEIVVPQSGYCGSYAASPRLVFALSWRGGAYRPATADFARLNVELPTHVEELLQAGVLRLGEDSVACAHHMVATAHAMAGRAGEAQAAYRRYSAARSATDPKQSWPLPIYVGSDEFEAELRDLLNRAETGRLGTWSLAESAVLHAQLGNTYESRFRGATFRAEGAERDGKTAEAVAARADAARFRTTARAAYQAALTLDPSEPESLAALARL
jgi:hypothetical protein